MQLVHFFHLLHPFLSRLNLAQKILAIDGIAFLDEKAGDGSVVGGGDYHFLEKSVCG